MARLGSMYFNIFKSVRSPFCLLQLVKNSHQIGNRFVHFELPGKDTKGPVEDNFDQYYQRLKLPYKLQHPEHRERSKQFIKLRIEQYPNGMKPLNVEDYRQLFDNLEGELRTKIVNDITMVLDYYNRLLCKSIFCPSTIPLADMEKILYDYTNSGARIRYIHFMFVREFDVWRKDLDLSERREQMKRKEEEELASFKEIGLFNEAGDLQYGFWRNTMFTRYFRQSRIKYSLHNLRQAQLFGQPIVIDCSFDETMADYETISVARQISSIYHANRFSVDPFHLMFCGFRESNRGYQHAFKHFQNLIKEPSFFFNLHQQTYKEILPGQRFVYLSPDARRLMTEFDPNAVYIIGALVSKTHKSKYSYEKSASEGIETVRLPIHQYVELKPGVKRVLSFQGVFKILLELKQHGDWERAFRAGIMSHKLVDG